MAREFQKIKMEGACFHVPSILSMTEAKFIEEWVDNAFHRKPVKVRKEMLSAVYKSAVKLYGKKKSDTPSEA